MDINFPLILVILTLVTGLIALADKLCFAKRRELNQKAMPWYIEYSRSLFPVFLFVLVVRSFIVEPYRIPSGSLSPSLLTGDFIVVNKFSYGLRLPITDTKILAVGEPKVGDIAVFHWPPNPSVDFIKRVIGVPGDRISYINKVLYVNGIAAQQQPDGTAMDSDEQGNTFPVNKLVEDLQGIHHGIYINPSIPAFDLKDIVVPKGYYLMVGDNRDNSWDGRYWGFVPESYLVGKGAFVLFSWDNIKTSLRWDRFGMKIH